MRRRFSVEPIFSSCWSKQSLSPFLVFLMLYLRNMHDWSKLLTLGTEKAEVFRILTW